MKRSKKSIGILLVFLVMLFSSISPVFVMATGVPEVFAIMASQDNPIIRVEGSGFAGLTPEAEVRNMDDTIQTNVPSVVPQGDNELMITLPAGLQTGHYKLRLWTDSTKTTSIGEPLGKPFDVIPSLAGQYDSANSKITISNATSNEFKWISSDIIKLSIFSGVMDLNSINSQNPKTITLTNESLEWTLPATLVDAAYIIKISKEVAITVPNPGVIDLPIGVLMLTVGEGGGGQTITSTPTPTPEEGGAVQQVRGIVYLDQGMASPSTVGSVYVIRNSDNFKVAESFLDSVGRYQFSGLGTGLYKMVAHSQAGETNLSSEQYDLEVLPSGNILINTASYSASTDFNMVLSAEVGQLPGSLPWDSATGEAMIRVSGLTPTVSLDVTGYDGDLSDLSLNVGYTPVTIMTKTLKAFTYNSKELVALSDIAVAFDTTVAFQPEQGVPGSALGGGDKGGGTVGGGSSGSSGTTGSYIIELGDSRSLFLHTSNENLVMIENVPYVATSHLANQASPPSDIVRGTYTTVLKFTSATLDTTVGDIKKLTFALGGTGENHLADYTSTLLMNAKLECNQPNAAAMIAPLFFYDKSAPKPSATFVGKVNTADGEKYKIDVTFNDIVNAASLVTNKDSYFAILNDNVSSNPSSAVPGTTDADGNTNTVSLFFTTMVNDSKIRVTGIADVFGNTMSAAYQKVIEVKLATVINVKDADGVNIPNVSVSIVRTDSIPSMGGESGAIAGQSVMLSQSQATTDQDGNATFSLVEGTYRVYSVSGGIIPMSTVSNTDVDFSVAMQVDVTQIDVNVSLASNTANVSGNIQVPEPNTETYDLFFVEKKFMQGIFVDVDAYALKEKFYKKITTDATGAFSGYLKPGTVETPKSYVLVGRVPTSNQWGTMESPMENIVINVTSAGPFTVSNSNPIVFSTTDITVGTLYKDAQNKIGNLEVKIIRTGLDYSLPPVILQIQSDEVNLGKITSKFTNGAYKIVSVTKSNYNFVGTSPGANDFAAYYDPNITFTLVGGVVTVFTGTSDMNTIILPEKNAEIKLIKKGNILNSGCEVNISDSDGNRFRMFNNAGGIFNLSLVSGKTYNVVSIFNQDIGMMNVSAMAQSTIAYAGTPKLGNDAISYDTGVGNVKIIVKNSDISAAVRPNINMNISGTATAGGMVWKWGRTDSSGEFVLMLAAGTYKIDGVDEGGKWKRVNQEFVVTDSHVVSAPLEVIYLMSPPNTHLTFQDDQATPQPLGTKWVNMRKIKSGNEWWDSYIGFMTDANGEYYTNLSAGNYVIEGIQTATGWKQFADETFTIVDGVNLNKIVTIAAPNFNAKLRKQDGTAIPYTWINVSRFTQGGGNGQLYDRWFGYSTNDQGLFSGELEAGHYIIEGISYFKSTGGGNGYHEWRELKKEFYVLPDVNGRLKIKETENGASISELQVVLLGDNFLGQLYKTYNPATDTGTLFTINSWGGNWTDANLVITESTVTDEQYRQEPWRYQRWINIKADSTFIATLDPTKNYIVREVFVQGQRYDVNIAIAGSDLAADSDFEIYPAKPNLNGEIRDYNGNIITTRGWIQFNVEENGVTQWHGAEIDSDGSFGRNFTVGTAVKIREVTIYSADMDWAKVQRFQVDRTVTVGTNSEDLTIKPNVKGIISFGTTFSMAPQFINVNLRPKMETTDDNYSDMMMNPWKYEKWVSATYDNSNQTAIFYANLNVGEYSISGISTNLTWMQMSEPFYIDPTAFSTNVTYNAALSSYQLTVNLSANVNGIVRKIDTTPVAGAFVSIEKTNADGTGLFTGQTNFNWSEAYFNANTNQSGAFGLKLKEGYYRINGYSTPWVMDNNIWIPGEWTPVSIRFKVAANGDLKTIADEALASIIIQPNLKVNVKKIFKAGEDATQFAEATTPGVSAKLKYAWVQIRPYKYVGGAWTLDETDWSNMIYANIGSSGDGILTLVPGRYKVLSAGGYNFWTNVNKTFDVDANGVIEDDSPDDDFAAINFIDETTKLMTIGQQAANFFGKVYYDADKADTHLIRNGWMSILPKNASMNDWSSYRWLGVKSDGTFEEYLENNGQGYKVVNVGGFTDNTFTQNIWLKTNVEMVFSGGVLGATNATYQGDAGAINIMPAGLNVVGTVKYKSNSGSTNGTIITATGGNAWLTIKPALNAQNDWSGTIGAQVDATGQFRVYADPGDYKVVSVGGFSVNESGQNEYFSYETDIRFTATSSGMTQSGSVITNLVVTPPLPNVTGYVTGNSGAGIGQGSIFFARFASNGTQVKIDGSAITNEELTNKWAGDDIHWWFVRWSEIDSSSNFALNLPIIGDGGYYKVINAYGQNGWFKSDAKFTLVTESAATVLKQHDDLGSNPQAVGSLTIGKPAPNVTINVSNAADSQYAWIEVEGTKADGAKFTQVIQNETKGTSSVNYTFLIRLDNGTFKVKSIWTGSSWNEVNKVFTVSGTTTENIDLTTLAAARKTVGGIITGTGGNSVWVGIKQYADNASETAADTIWVETDVNGAFSYEIDSDPNVNVAVKKIRSADGIMTIATDALTIVDTDVDHTTAWNIAFVTN